MAIVILGGLLSATALNMVVLPALYWIAGEREAASETIVVESNRLVEAPLPIALGSR